MLRKQLNQLLCYPLIPNLHDRNLERWDCLDIDGEKKLRACVVDANTVIIIINNIIINNIIIIIIII